MIHQNTIFADRFFLPGALLLALVGCGGGGSPTAPVPAPPGPSTQSLSVTGTARASGANGCSGETHPFDAAPGEIRVTLISTTGGVGMAVQVCAGGIDNGNCSIQLHPIAVGETVSGARIGEARQVLAFNTANCGGGGPAPANPVEYAATVTFQR